MGLAQRASLVHQLIERHPGTLVLDTGTVGDDAERAAAVLDAMGHTPYHAVGVQASDLAFGDVWKEATQRGLKVVGPQTPVRWFVLGRKALEVSGPRDGAGTPMPILVAVLAGPYWRAGLERLRQASTNGGRPDLVVCLGEPEGGYEMLTLATRDITGPGCGIVVAGNGIQAGARCEAGVLALPLPRGGDTVCLVTGVQKPQGIWEWHVQQKPVTGDMPAEPAVKRIIDAYYIRMEETFRAAAQQVNDEDASDEGDALRVAAELGYVPAWGCRNCHEDAFARWQKSMHARAIRTLADKSRLVPECIHCHSEEFQRMGRLLRTKPAPANVTSKLASQELLIEGGVECASCHGPSLVHAALGTRETAERGNLKGCVSCHDAERSPKYDAPKYWEAIRH